MSHITPTHSADHSLTWGTSNDPYFHKPSNQGACARFRMCRGVSSGHHRQPHLPAAAAASLPNSFFMLWLLPHLNSSTSASAPQTSPTPPPHHDSLPGVLYPLTFKFQVFPSCVVSSTGQRPSQLGADESVTQMTPLPVQSFLSFSYSFHVLPPLPSFPWHLLSP